MLWFLSLAAERSFVVEDWEDPAEGTLGQRLTHLPHESSQTQIAIAYPTSRLVASGSSRSHSRTTAGVSGSLQRKRITCLVNSVMVGLSIKRQGRARAPGNAPVERPAILSADWGS